MAAAEKRVTEYALSRVLSDGTRQGLYSHEDRALVEHVKIREALKGVTGLVITERNAVYPLNEDGSVNHHKSTVDEVDLALALVIGAAAVLAFLISGSPEAFMLAVAPAAVPRRTFLGRGYTERYNFVSAAALSINGNTPFSKEFRLGAGWYKMWLRFVFSFTVGTGTTALSDATLRIIKKIFFKTDRGELICNEPGRAMFYIANYRLGTNPFRTTFAASTGTYEVDIPILFTDDYMDRPEDTVLDTARYESLDLEIQLGGVADLLGTVGTSSVTATLDIDVERSYGKLPDKAKPHYFISYDHRAPQDASVNPNIELEKSPDLSIKRLYFFTGDTGLAGIPWSGNANDTYPVKTNIQDQDRFIEKDRKHPFVQSLNKLDASLEAVAAGVEVYDWVRDGSITSALSTGEKSSLQLQLTQSGAAAASIITATHEGIRLLKA